ncbi:MAG: hypothetical protein GX561_08565 [Lentisphaerae bacterium]|nr:hypothetical protein [Lentisphaerota bacterium]
MGLRLWDVTSGFVDVEVLGQVGRDPPSRCALRRTGRTVGQICPASGRDEFRYGTRGARTQAMSPLKRLNMTKPQPDYSPRFALLQNKTSSGTGTRVLVLK